MSHYRDLFIAIHFVMIPKFLWVLLLFNNALYCVSGGGTKWNPQTEHAHRVYSAARNDPCDPTLWGPSDDAWRYTGDKSPPRSLSADQLCKAALGSLMAMHWTSRPDCANPLGAACRDHTCFVFMEKKCLWGRQDASVPFRRCAKQVVAEHGAFLQGELKQQKANAPKVSGPCGCPHCRNCPLKPYGCPYCPTRPKKVNPLEMAGENYYPQLAAKLPSLQIPESRSLKGTRTAKSPLRFLGKSFNTQQTQNARPDKGKQVVKTQSRKVRMSASSSASSSKSSYSPPWGGQIKPR